MYTINMYESSIYKNNIQSTPYYLNFETIINEDTILFENPTFEDYNRIKNILDIQISITSFHNSLKKSIGQVKTSLWAFNKATPNYEKWKWILDSNDISSLENVRTGDIVFNVQVKAILVEHSKDNCIVPILGEGQIRFSESDWLRFIRSFGYSTKYGNNLSQSLLNDKSWVKAYELLDDAREHMYRGKTYDALRQCLSVMESYMDSDKRGGPYSPRVWEELLQDITPQKKDGIEGMLAGVATYLNKVGHHRNSKIKDNGNLPYIPLDQYEVELLLSISQLIITYLERLKSETM